MGANNLRELREVGRPTPVARGPVCIALGVMAALAVGQPPGDLSVREGAATQSADEAQAPPDLSEPAAFTEEALDRGLDYEIEGVFQWSYGSAAFADLDGDGFADVVAVGRADGLVGVFENDGDGTFTDRSGSTGIPPLENASGITAADYDADGDLDLFISRYLADDALLRNDGDFQFTDVTDDLGVAGSAGAGGGTAWGDYDGDGWLDLYVSNRTGSTLPDVPPSTVRNRLYRNLGGTGFTDVAPQLGVEDDDAPTLTCAFFDYDRDGDADLHLGTDRGDCINEQDRTYENVGGSFVDVTAETNTAACTHTMGIGIGDFDGNLLPDLYTTNVPAGNALMMQQPGGTFTYEAEDAGVASYALGWGCMFLDYDNDGQQELYVCNVGADNRLYDNRGGWPCDDMAGALDLDHAGPSYNISAADIDHDGDLDLLVQDTPGRLRLHVNHQGQRRRWVRLNIQGVHPNVDAIGAIVRVRTGDAWQTREVLAGGNNYRSQSELALTFGLGTSAQQADEIIVEWPSGESRTFEGYAAGEAWTLPPPQNLGDGDGDGRLEAGELADLLDGMGEPLKPGLEHLDFNGDAVIDAADLERMARRMEAGEFAGGR